jgi:hypothetical protein
LPGDGTWPPRSTLARQTGYPIHLLFHRSTSATTRRAAATAPPRCSSARSPRPAGRSMGALPVQQASARRRRLLAGTGRTPSQRLPNAPPDRTGVAQKGAPGHLPGTVLMPPVEQPVRGPEQFRSNLRPRNSGGG